MNTQTNDGIVREVILSKITVDHVKDHAFKDDVLSCQLRQIVTKRVTYPCRVNNSKQDSLYTAEELGISSKIFESSSIRIAWVEVPLNAKAEEIEKRLNNNPNAKIYQIVSTNIEDLLTEGQIYNISEGILDIETVKESCILKNKEGNHIFDSNGNQIYRKCFLSLKNQEDIIKVEKVSVTEELLDEENVA